MANSVQIQRGGKLLYTLLDPNYGTLTQPATAMAYFEKAGN